MMRESKTSSLFLMELIVSLTLFAVCAAVCLGLFAAARRAGTESTDLSCALLRAQNVAETLKSADGDPQEAAQLLGAQAEGDGFALHYDAQWRACGADGAAHTLTVRVRREGNLRRCAVVVGEIYSLDVVCRAP